MHNMRKLVENDICPFYFWTNLRPAAKNVLDKNMLFKNMSGLYTTDLLFFMSG